MQSADLHVLNAIRLWATSGHRFMLATVARTWGSAPRPAGSWMAVREDGQVQGSVSGGCIEADLIAKVLDKGWESILPFALLYGVSQDEARRFGLPCGGTMELVIEPCPDQAALQDLEARIAQGQLVKRSIGVGNASTSISAGAPADTVSWDGQTLTTLHGPAWRLLIICAGQTSAYLAQMAQALDYQVFVCDPRSEYAAGWNVAGAPLLAVMPDDAVTELNPDPHTCVVALTHDPRLDDMALLEALKSPAFYVGALGSVVNNERRRERLLQHFDLAQAEVDRLHGPVGLPIGSRTPAEIALSILAEMTALRNGAWNRHGPVARRRSDAACSVT